MNILWSYDDSLYENCKVQISETQDGKTQSSEASKDTELMASCDHNIITTHASAMRSMFMSTLQ